jgi:hypothetical protein
MKNSFIFGRAVVGEHFVDGEKEVDELKSPGHVGKAVKSMEGMGLMEGNRIVEVHKRRVGQKR